MLGSEGCLLVLRLLVRLLLVRRLLRLLEDLLERLLVRLVELFLVIIPYSGSHPGGIRKRVSFSQSARTSNSAACSSDQS